MSEAKDNQPSEDRPANETDPTKDATFQKVVGYFLRTPPKPHDTEKAKREPKREKPEKDRRPSPSTG